MTPTRPYIDAAPASLRLTQAIRSAPGCDIPLAEGYRLEMFRDAPGRAGLPMLAAAVDADRVFDCFLDLLKPLGSRVHAVLETSHGMNDDRHEDRRRAHIDTAVLQSHFCDYEDLLTHDGCTGVAVVAKNKPMEVQFDEHKLLFVYARDLRPFRKILRRHGVRRRDGLRLVAEGEHLHRTTARNASEFEELCCRLGIADFSAALEN